MEQVLVKPPTKKIYAAAKVTVGETKTKKIINVFFCFHFFAFAARCQWLYKGWQRLVFEGVELAEGHRTLAGCGVRLDSSLHLLRAGSTSWVNVQTLAGGQFPAELETDSFDDVYVAGSLSVIIKKNVVFILIDCLTCQPCI
jgi:hypothetical protein